MDPEQSVEALLGPPPVIEPEVVIIPVRPEPMPEPEPVVMAEASNRKRSALFRPQIFVQPRRFFKQQIKRGKSKRLVMFAGGFLIAAALALGLFRFGTSRAATQAAGNTADSFVKAEFAGDTAKALRLSDPGSVKQNNLEAFARLVAPNLKDQPTRTGHDIQKHDGKHRAVFTYQFSITSPGQGTDGDETPVYLVLLLQKDQGKWLVKSQSMSAVAPMADVSSYPDSSF